MTDRVVLISPGEKLVHEVGESRFFYRRLDAEERAQIDDKMWAMKGKRKIDFKYSTVGLEYLKRGIQGWEKVFDGEGQEVPFALDKILLLPGEIVTDLIEKIRGITEEEELEEEEEKNSEIS